MLVLLHALADADGVVREAAARGLGSLGPEPEQIVPALVALLEDSRHETSVAAGQMLAALDEGTRLAVPRLAALLSHREAEFPRCCAAWALMLFGPAASKAVPCWWQPWMTRPLRCAMVGLCWRTWMKPPSQPWPSSRRC